MDEITSLKDLYLKVKPALTTKRGELKRIGIYYIKEEDIWNALRELKWLKASNLSLSEMVNDILEISNDTIDMYVKKQLSRMDKYADTDGNSFID